MHTVSLINIKRMHVYQLYEQYKLFLHTGMGGNLCKILTTGVKPLEYQAEYKALEQSLNITM